MKRPKTQVYKIHDGSSEYFVRGTQDPAEALALITADDEYLDYCPPPPLEDQGHDLEPFWKPEGTGWYRFNVCAPGDDYGWTLRGPVLADPHKPGWFPGTYGSVEYRELAFNYDLERGLDA